MVGRSLEGVCRSDPIDRARYKPRGFVISINDGRFFDHIRAAGGAGAIDLVIHATGWRFAEALRFLKTLEPPPEPDARGSRPHRRMCA